MGFELENVVPWGRSLEDYIGMFDLSSADLNQRILDCGGGPASFNAELTSKGCRVVSCDPLYRFSTGDIARRIDETYAVILDGVESEKERFVWTRIGSPARLGEIRMSAMRRFLEDFDAGLGQGRYVAEGLPKLPFGADEFDLALSSHFLFLYSEQLDTDFHVVSILEMLRVARQARIFPLLDMDGKLSAHLRPVLRELERQGHEPRLQEVPYEFQRGGCQMLLVDRASQGCTPAVT